MPNRIWMTAEFGHPARPCLASITLASTAVFVSVSGSSPLQIECGQNYCTSQAEAVYTIGPPTINIFIYYIYIRFGSPDYTNIKNPPSCEADLIYFSMNSSTVRTFTAASLHINRVFISVHTDGYRGIEGLRIGMYDIFKFRMWYYRSCTIWVSRLLWPSSSVKLPVIIFSISITDNIDKHIIISYSSILLIALNHFDDWNDIRVTERVTRLLGVNAIAQGTREFYGAIFQTKM